MATKFNYAVKYQIEAVCRTPLRTGNADGEVDAILCDQRGVPFIQGNSISGALRNWLEKESDEELVEKLFGSRQQEGNLIISDGVFTESAQKSIRPRLRINGKTGTAEDGGKFDVMHVAKDSKMNFSLTWLGQKTNQQEVEAVEQMLSALDCGIIRLGAHKGSGFGLFSLKVKKEKFDLTLEKDRENWLYNCMNGKEIALPVITGYMPVEITLYGHTDSILVKASVENHENDKTYIANLMEGNKPVIPGSSIKGAVRSRVEGIAKVLSVNENIVDQMFGKAAEGLDDGKMGTVYFEDIYLDRSRREKITRIRINRFTGGVMRKHLFVEEPLSTEVKLHIIMPEEPVSCMLLVYALRDLGLGLYNIGSGGAIGRGYLSVDSIEIKTPNQKKAMLQFDQRNQCICKDSGKILQNWAQVLEG